MVNNRKFEVRRKCMTSTDVVSLELVPLDGLPLDTFAPGAHIDLRLRRPGHPPFTRQYSLCNAPHETDAYVLGIKREPASRGGSAIAHDHLAEGHTVEVSAPRDHFRLAADAGFHLLLAAGIGITPLLAMAQSLEVAGRDYALHYFTRSAAHIAFAERIQHALDPARVHIRAGLTVQETHEMLRDVLRTPRAGAHAYACGPLAFMDAVVGIAEPIWGSERLHFEHFQASPARYLPDTAFDVELARSGVVCTVQPGESIVQALAFVGHEVEVSCEQGVCGTCLTFVREGRPEHRDAYLSETERAAGDRMLLCVSRSLTARLVLDR